MKPVRFSRSSRRHRIGKASAHHVMTNTASTELTSPATGEKARRWEGDDERGRRLEIFAIEKPDCWLVIHVMPVHYRRRS